MCSENREFVERPRVWSARKRLKSSKLDVLRKEEHWEGETYNHGVQTSTGESRSTNEVLCRLEQSGKISLESVGGSIRLGRSIVEALVDSIGRSRKGKKDGS